MKQEWSEDETAPSIPQGGSDQTQPSFDANEIRASAATGDSERYYMNEAGLVVFTAKYLLERGYCCGNGCKHCPYDYEAVPEPKRSALLAKNKHEF